MTSPQQLFNVANKNVLVSGGSRGIGYMIASTYYRHGANVLLTSRDAKACEEAAASIVSTNIAFADGINAPRVYHVPSNVSTREGCKALAEHTNDVFQGRLDVLVNNAGTSWGEDPGYDVGSRQSGRMNWGWDKVLDLNVKGVFYLIRECVPMLQRRRIEKTGEGDKDGDGDAATQSIFSTEPPIDPGRIINIGSVTGFIPQNAPTHAYDVSKAAVHHLTKKLAADLAPRGITVNALVPGYVPSRMSSGLSTWLPTDTTTDSDGRDKKQKSDIYEEATKTVPLGRMGNEDDMGGTCIYLSSKAGSWCTGVILNVDGGSVGAMQIPLSSL
eukprot:g6352.t1 g6352   contig23:269459-270445(+)